MKTRKFFSLLLAALMIFSCMGNVAFAQESVQTEEVTENEVEMLATSVSSIAIDLSTTGVSDQKCTSAKGTDALGRSVRYIYPADVSGAVAPASFTVGTVNHNAIKVVYKAPSTTTPEMSVFRHNDGSWSGTGKVHTAIVDTPLVANAWNTVYFDVTEHISGNSDYIHAIMFRPFASESASAHVGEDIQIGYVGYFGDLEDARAHVSDFEGDLNITSIELDGVALDGFATETTTYEYDLNDLDVVPAVTVTGTGNSSGLTITSTEVDTTKGTATATIKDGDQTLYTINFTGGAILTDVESLAIRYTYETVGSNNASYYNGVNEDDILGRSVHRIMPNPEAATTSNVSPGSNLSSVQTQYTALKAVYKSTDTQPFIFRPITKDFSGSANVSAKETKTVDGWTVAYYNMADLFAEGGALEAGLYYYMGTVFSKTIGNLPEDTKIDFGCLTLFGSYADAKVHVSDYEGDLNITSIKVDGTALADFATATTVYTYDLDGASTVPEVTLEGTGDASGLAIEYTDYDYETGTATATVEKDGEILYTINFTGGAATTDFTPVELTMSYHGVSGHRCELETGLADSFGRTYTEVNIKNQYYDSSTSSDIVVTGTIAPGGSVPSDGKSADYKILKIVLKCTIDEVPTFRAYPVTGSTVTLSAMNADEYSNSGWTTLYYDYSTIGALNMWQFYFGSEDVSNYLEDTISVGYIGLFGSLGDAILHESVYEGDFAVTDVLLDGTSIGNVTAYDYDLAGAGTPPALTIKATGDTDNVVITNGSLDAEGNATSTVTNNSEVVVTISFTGGSTTFGVTGISCDGVEIEAFDAETTEYTVELPYAAAQPTVDFEYSGTMPETVEVAYETVEGVGYKAYIMDGEEVLYTVIFNVEQTKPTDLLNTLYKIKNDGELVVGYFGGSVTAGTGSTSDATCWRGLTRDWLRATFCPYETEEEKEAAKSIIVERNAGWGGTGAIFGIFRADLNLIKDDCPDLVFVEMCINDSYDGIYGKDEQYVYIESIIQKLYKANPKIDIVLLVTGDNSTMKKDIPATGDAPTYGEPYTVLAEHYDLPILYIGHELAKTIYAENGNAWPATSGDVWHKYFKRTDGNVDAVHPNNAGYAHYAATIIDYLESQLPTSYTPTADEYQDKTLPETLYCTDNNKGSLLSDAYMIAPENVGNSAGFGNYSVTASTGGYFRSSNEGDVISLTFNAKSIGAWTWSYGTQNDKNGTDITYSIDGGEIQTANIYRSYPNNKIYYFAKDLSEGEHTIRIYHNDSNTPFDVRYFLFWGQSEGLDKTITAVSPISLVDDDGTIITDETTGEPIINATITLEGATDEENAKLEEIFNFDPSVYRYEIPISVTDGKAEIELLSDEIEYPEITVTVPDGYYGYSLTQAGAGGTGTNVAILSVDNVADYEFTFVISGIPENYTVTQATTAFGNDAKITFAEATTETLQIKRHDADDWTSYDAGITEITGLCAGKYTMRYTDGENTGSEVEVSVWEVYPEGANVLYVADDGTGDGLTPEAPASINTNILNATTKIKTLFADTYQTNENYIVMVGDTSHTNIVGSSNGPSLSGGAPLTITTEQGARFYMHYHINHISGDSAPAKVTWKNVDVVLGTKEIRLGDRAKYEAGDLSGVPGNSAEIYYSAYGHEVTFDNFNIVEYYPAAVYVQYCTYNEDGTVAAWTADTKLYTGDTVRRTDGLYMHYFADGSPFTSNAGNPITINSPGLNIHTTRSSGYNSATHTGDVYYIVEDATIMDFGMGAHGSGAVHNGNEKGVINGGNITRYAYVGAQSDGKTTGSALLVVNGGTIATIKAKDSSYNALDTALIINNGLSYTVDSTNIDYYLKSGVGGSADATFGEDNTIESFVFTTSKDNVVIDGTSYDVTDGTATVAAATVGTGEHVVEYKNDDVNINFNVGTIGASVDALAVERGSSVSVSGLPAPTVSDGINEFKGWSYTAGGEIIADESITVDAEMTLYAVYGVITHDITYLAGDNKYATVPSATSCENNGEITVAAAPVFNNGAKYKFLGYSDGTATYQPDESITGISADTELTALWEIDETVIYVDDILGCSDGGDDPSCPLGPKGTIFTETEVDVYTTTNNGTVYTFAATIECYSPTFGNSSYANAANKLSSGGTIIVVGESWAADAGSGEITVKGYSEDSVLYISSSVYFKGKRVFDGIDLRCVYTDEAILGSGNNDLVIKDNCVVDNGFYYFPDDTQKETPYYYLYYRSYGTSHYRCYTKGSTTANFSPFTKCVSGNTYYNYKNSTQDIRLAHSNYGGTFAVNDGSGITVGTGNYDLICSGANYNSAYNNISEAINGNRSLVINNGNIAKVATGHVGYNNGVHEFEINGGSVTTFTLGNNTNQASDTTNAKNTMFGLVYARINGGSIGTLNTSGKGLDTEPTADDNGNYSITVSANPGNRSQMGVTVAEINGGTVGKIQFPGYQAALTKVVIFNNDTSANVASGAADVVVYSSAAGKVEAIVDTSATYVYNDVTYPLGEAFTFDGFKVTTESVIVKLMDKTAGTEIKSYEVTGGVATIPVSDLTAEGNTYEIVYVATDDLLTVEASKVYVERNEKTTVVNPAYVTFRSTDGTLLKSIAIEDASTEIKSETKTDGDTEFTVYYFEVSDAFDVSDIAAEGAIEVFVEKNGYLSKKVGTYNSVSEIGGDLLSNLSLDLVAGDIKGSYDDLCGDGTIDIFDFLRIIRGFSSESDDRLKAAVDIDEDGVVTIADLVLVKANYGKVSG